MGDLRLVVQADDLGMCRAVNEGIGLAASDGILTQVSAMAPTPWFNEGVHVAKRHDLGVGMHVTLTCEWDNLRWGPLTPAPSLRGPDGTFHRTIEAAAQHGDPAEVMAEVEAQADRITAAGLVVSYVDPHMNIGCVEAQTAMCERFGVLFDYPGPVPHHVWDSMIVLSVAPRHDRPGWLAQQLDELEPGTHFVLTHPGVAGPELAALADPGAANAPWAEPIRVNDLAALCAPEVRAVVERRGIDLVAARDL